MYVYIIRNENMYKIGKANDIKARLNTLQTASPNPLEIVAIANSDNAIALEKQIHRYAKKYHVRGEWFLLDDDAPRAEEAESNGAAPGEHQKERQSHSQQRHLRDGGQCSTQIGLCHGQGG